MLNGGAGSLVLNLNFLKSIPSDLPLSVFSFHYKSSLAKKHVSKSMTESLWLEFEYFSSKFLLLA